ncbi:MAG: CoA-transferase [Pseudomonadota bacterium]
MTTSKLMNMTEAISRWVVDGSSVAIGTTLETAIPFAAGHEIMRQGKKGLVLIGPISDMLFDQIIGAGCVKRVQAAWVGNVITGVGYNFRRAAEQGRIDVEDHSNLTISMALQAGAMGVSFLPSRTALGSNLFTTNPGLKTVMCPFTGQKHAAIAAIVPDVAIVHVQRSDSFGNAHAWGNMGITREACMASRNVILTAEEIVSTEMITRDPNRILTPGFKVSAVVHAPWGAHPSPMPGYYNRDHAVFLDYQTQSRTPELFALWMNQWIHAIASIHDYVETLGDDYLKRLSITHHAYSEPVDYGY